MPLITSLCITVSVAASAGSTPPNILMIVWDDLGVDQVAADQGAARSDGGVVEHSVLQRVAYGLPSGRGLAAAVNMA